MPAPDGNVSMLSVVTQKVRMGRGQAVGSICAGACRCSFLVTSPSSGSEKEGQQRGGARA